MTKLVKFDLGTETGRGVVVKENEETVLVELLYDSTPGEDIPLEQLKTGKIIKRHKVKHKVEEIREC